MQGRQIYLTFKASQMDNKLSIILHTRLPMQGVYIWQYDPHNYVASDLVHYRLNLPIHGSIWGPHQWFSFWKFILPTHGR